jgi:hypothetical protein
MTAERRNNLTNGPLLGNALLSTFSTQRVGCTMQQTDRSGECSLSGPHLVIQGHVIHQPAVLPCGALLAGSNTFTVTLTVVGGDEKGSLDSETVKYGHESHGTRTRK